MPLINLNVTYVSLPHPIQKYKNTKIQKYKNTKIPNGTNAAPAAMIKTLNGMGVKLAPKIAEKYCQKMIQPSV